MFVCFVCPFPGDHRFLAFQCDSSARHAFAARVLWGHEFGNAQRHLSLPGSRIPIAARQSFSLGPVLMSKNLPAKKSRVWGSWQRKELLSSLQRSCPWYLGAASCALASLVATRASARRVAPSPRDPPSSPPRGWVWKLLPFALPIRAAWDGRGVGPN